MISPFPGMDPYLEINPRWEGFHGWFVRKLAEQALPKARSLGCWIDVERTIYHQSPSGEFLLLGAPDDAVGVEATFASGNGSPKENLGVAVAEPKVTRQMTWDVDTEEHRKQDYLVVRELGHFNRVLAVVEVLSPANKSGNYAPRYQEKRRRYLESRSHFMEIDFLRGGANPSRDGFSDLIATPYFIFVVRKSPMGWVEEGYPVRLQDPLPVVGLPIGPPRPDLPLDLASAFRAAHELSVRPGNMNYKTEDVPPPPLSTEDAAWVKSVIEQ